MKSKMTFLLIISSLIFIGLIIIYISAIDSNEPKIIRESVVMTPSDDLNLVTQNSYTGLLNITISGYITSSTSEENIDMYYMFNHLDDYEILEVQSILSINDNIALPPNGGGLVPMYADNHTYSFAYFIGDEEQPIEFRLNPEELALYSGSLLIEIETIPNYGGR